MAERSRQAPPKEQAPPAEQSNSVTQEIHKIQQRLRQRRRRDSFDYWFRREWRRFLVALQHAEKKTLLPFPNDNVFGSLLYRFCRQGCCNFNRVTFVDHSPTVDFFAAIRIGLSPSAAILQVCVDFKNPSISIDLFRVATPSMYSWLLLRVDDRCFDFGCVVGLQIQPDLGAGYVYDIDKFKEACEEWVRSLPETEMRFSRSQRFPIVLDPDKCDVEKLVSEWFARANLRMQSPAELSEVENLVRSEERVKFGEGNYYKLTFQNWSGFR